MKPIKVTKAQHRTMLKQFEEFLNTHRSATGTVNFSVDYSKTYNFPKEKPTVAFTTNAWYKMRALVDECSVEVAWHGVVERIDRFNYLITDILVYPQTATAATVESDDARYPAWCANISDEDAPKIRFQGHSHVRMGVTPSGTDTANWDSILQTLSDKGFYIFLITNKTGTIHCVLYDLDHNIFFENGDVTVKVLMPDGVDVNAWAKEELEKQLVQRKSYAPAPLTTTQTTLVERGAFFEDPFYSETDLRNLGGYYAKSKQTSRVAKSK